MNDFNLSFHHLGLAVTKKEPAIHFIKGLGYKISDTVYDMQQEVNLVFCQHDIQPDIEIIFSSDKVGPLDQILKKNDTLIYHTCYTTHDIKNTIEIFKQHKIRTMLISPPKPAILFNNRQVAFYYVQGFGLIELLQVEI